MPSFQDLEDEFGSDDSLGVSLIYKRLLPHEVYLKARQLLG
jgi:hypothetical protein